MARRLSEATDLAVARRLRSIGTFEYDRRFGMLRWSDETYRLYGVSPRTFRPSPAAERALLRPGFEHLVAGLDTLAGDATAAESQLSCEFEIVRSDRRIRVLHRDCELVCDRAGDLVGIVGTIEDVTEARAAEQRCRSLEHQLRHFQRTDALGTLSAGIAHDLNNMLLPILTLAELLIENAEPGTPSADMLRIIREAAQRGRRLAAQIVAFCRKEDGLRQTLDLGELVRSSLAMIRAVLPSTMRIASRIEPSPRIVADPTQLQQVLLNLMTNAAQAIGDGRQGRIEVSVAPTGDRRGVRLTIADDGCGMDEATRRRAFEPFFTTRSIGEGSGLGLSIVHNIVAAHGGRTELASAPGRGTSVDVVLDGAPLAAPSEAVGP